MVFNTHNNILGIQVPITNNTSYGKQITDKLIIQEQVYGNNYIVSLPNSKQKVL